jgi:G:T-mismatch repair DNA endonuclease (very short patch repair protein)
MFRRVRNYDHIERACAQCGTVFVVPLGQPDRKLCTGACRGQWSARNRRVAKVTCTCEYCGKDFEIKPGGLVHSKRGSNRKFCSKSCADANRIGKKTARVLTPREVILCSYCGKEFEIESYYLPRKKYCSRSCRAYAGRAACFQGIAKARRSRTNIERETASALSSLGLQFSVQYPLGYYKVDFFLSVERVVIECQGDYWHCNPAVYTNGPTNAIQRNSIDRDRRKRIYLEKCGLRVIELWGRDIKREGALALIQQAMRL